MFAWSTFTIKFICANNIVADLYEPASTSYHASVLVDEKLYLWAGWRLDIPDVHSSAEKLRATAYVDVFHCRLGMWVRYALCARCIGHQQFHYYFICEEKNMVIVAYNTWKWPFSTSVWFLHDSEQRKVPMIIYFDLLTWSWIECLQVILNLLIFAVINKWQSMAN